MGIRYEQVHYLASYGTVEQLPQPKAPEASFVGHSNVGKSSLINRLFNRKSLIKVSSKPGKTAYTNTDNDTTVDSTEDFLQSWL